MSKHQHTPGPYTADGTTIIESASGVDLHVAYCHAPNGDPLTLNADANARLFAASPDLLAACETLVYETTHLSPTEDDGSHWCKIGADALDAARAAVKQATGDES